MRAPCQSAAEWKKTQPWFFAVFVFCLLVCLFHFQPRCWLPGTQLSPTHLPRLPYDHLNSLSCWSVNVACCVFRSCIRGARKDEMLDDVLIGCPSLCPYTKARDLCPWRWHPHPTVWLLQCRMKVVVDIGKKTMRWWLHIRNKKTHVWGRRIEGKRRESVQGTEGSRGVRKFDFS